MEILNLILNYRKDLNETTLFVRAELWLSDQELLAKGKYHFIIEIKARDFGQAISKDGVLQKVTEEFQLSDSNLSWIQDNRLNFERAYVVSNDLLDEDRGSDEDEIYVQFGLISFLNPQERMEKLSNMVKDHWEKK